MNPPRPRRNFSGLQTVFNRRQPASAGASRGVWAIIALTQCGVYGTLALLAGRVREWLQGRPASGVLATRYVGGLLIAVAFFTGLEALWPA